MVETATGGAGGAGCGVGAVVLVLAISGLSQLTLNPTLTSFGSSGSRRVAKVRDWSMLRLICLAVVNRFQRSTDSKISFNALNVGATYDSGEEPVLGRVHMAVGPEILSWIGKGFIGHGQVS